jgi:hypothetical protein
MSTQKTYYIYHIPGIKIGCTTNIEHRMQEQSFTTWEVLEEYTDIMIASERERELQISYGYPKDPVLYHISLKNRSRLGAKYTESHRKNISDSVKGKSRNYSKEHIQACMNNLKIASSNGGKKTGKINGYKSCTTEHLCPKCGRTGKGNYFKHFHFDSCKLQSKQQDDVN